jgi:hypothetical protein
MKKMPFMLALVCVFIAGLFLGSVGTLMTTRRLVRNAMAHGPGGAEASGMMMQALAWHLDLRPDQREAVKEAVRKVMVRMAPLRVRQNTEFAAALEEMRSALLPTLDEDQRVRLEEWINRAKQRMLMPPPGPRGPHDKSGPMRRIPYRTPPPGADPAAPPPSGPIAPPEPI